MSKNTISIDGEKLRNIIERRLGFNIYEFAEANGYSRNIISQTIRSGKASPLIQNLLRLYSVAPEEYEYKEEILATPTDPQLTFEDIEVDSISRSELKAIVREAIIDTLNSLEWRLDTKTNTVTFIVNKEAE